MADNCLQSDVQTCPKRRLKTADDDQPATRTWCDSVGVLAGSMFWGDEWIPQIRGLGQWVQLPKGATRRDVLEIIRILKLDLESPF